MKKISGITMISLVVTIIILIILVGVSINLILGQDGILTKAREAKENIELAQIEEQTQLNTLYYQISEEGYGNISYDSISKLLEFKKVIAKAITDAGIETSADASSDTMANNIQRLPNSSVSKLEQTLIGSCFGYTVGATSISYHSINISNVGYKTITFSVPTDTISNFTITSKKTYYYLDYNDGTSSSQITVNSATTVEIPENVTNIRASIMINGSPTVAQGYTERRVTITLE